MDLPQGASHVQSIKKQLPRDQNRREQKTAYNQYPSDNRSV